MADGAGHDNTRGPDLGGQGVGADLGEVGVVKSALEVEAERLGVSRDHVIEMEETLRLYSVIGAGWRALHDIATHGDSPNGYWHQSRALLALEELDGLDLHQ